MKSKLILAALAIAGVSTAQAETIYGLTDTGGLISFDSATPGTTTSIGNLQATATAGDTIRSIDFRPSGSQGGAQLYAIGVDATNTSAQIYVVDYNTGVMTAQGARITLTGNTSANVQINFNPSANLPTPLTPERLRIITGSGASYRWNPVTNAFVAQDTTLSYSGGGSVAAGGVAYSNSFVGAQVTTLFGYDTSTNNLIRIGGFQGPPSPNLGNVTAIGPSGLISFNDTVPMDIGAFGGIAYAAMNTNATPVDNFYTINLNTGAFTLLGAIGGGQNIIGITVTAVPEPATVAAGVLAIGAVGLHIRRRRQAKA